MAGFLNVTMAGAAMNVALAVVGVLVAWALARLLDRAIWRSSQSTASGWWVHVIKADPRALALYFAARWVGICLLVGLLFSRPY
jgi:ABC-type arginine transport system permease subunit